METVSITAITFPIRSAGVSAYTKDIICTAKTVEQTIIKKQHTTINR